MKKGLLLIIIFCVSSMYAASIWRDRNIYSAGDTLKPGDTVVVAINDLSRVKFGMNMKSKSTSNLSSNPDVSITGFLPKIKGDRSSDNSDTMGVESRNNLNFTIAAQITGAQGRNFIIQGAKEYVINGVSTRFTVAGIIDPSLMNGSIIKADNVVNFRLDIITTKRGMGINITRPALQPQENAKADLTEEEKQRMIVDYLNRMIEELTRR